MPARKPSSSESCMHVGRRVIGREKIVEGREIDRAIEWDGLQHDDCLREAVPGGSMAHGNELGSGLPQSLTDGGVQRGVASVRLGPAPAGADLDRQRHRQGAPPSITSPRQRGGRSRPRPPAPRRPARHAPAAASAPRGRPRAARRAARTMARLMTSAAPPWKGALIAARSAPARRTMSLAPMSGIQSLPAEGGGDVAVQPRLLLQPLHGVADAGILARNRHR